MYHFKNNDLNMLAAFYSSEKSSNLCQIAFNYGIIPWLPNSVPWAGNMAP